MEIKLIIRIHKRVTHARENPDTNRHSSIAPHCPHKLLLTFLVLPQAMAATASGLELEKSSFLTGLGELEGQGVSETCRWKLYLLKTMFNMSPHSAFLKPTELN